MNWGGAGEFFAMGGYGLYVWGSYAVAVLLMGAEPLLARHRHAEARRAAARADEDETGELR